MNYIRSNIEALLKKNKLNPTQLSLATGVSQPTIFRILTGESESPRDSTISPIAEYFGLTSQQLRYEKLSPSGAAVAEPRAIYNANPLHKPVWLISWVQAGAFCDAEQPYPVGEGEALISCPEPHSSTTYALRIHGASMDDGTLDGYRDGDIIFVDPEITAKHNDDVIVRTPEGSATFKRYQDTNDGKFLLALNRDWPQRIINVPKDTVICGVVIGSYRTRRYGLPMKSCFLPVLSLILLGASVSATAAIYQCTDANGRSTFSSTPCGENATEMDIEPAAMVGSNSEITETYKQMNDAGFKDMKRRSINRDISTKQSEIEELRNQMDREIRILTIRSSRAKNNLGGAIYGQQQAVEKQTVVDKYNGRIQSKEKEIEYLRKELDEL